MTKEVNLTFLDIGRDFQPAPGLKGYYISRDGRIVHVVFKELDGFCTGRGRNKVVGIKRDGRLTVKRIDKLVAGAFLNKGDALATTDNVKHKDGDHNNNNVDNLQIVHHYCGRDLITVPDKIRCVETGRIYDELIDASRDLGISSTRIKKYLEGKCGVVDGKHFEYVNIPTPKFIYKPKIRGKAVVCIETGEIYRKSIDVATEIGVTKQAVNEAITTSSAVGGKHYDFVDRKRKILVGDVRCFISDLDWYKGVKLCDSLAEMGMWAQGYLKKKSGDVKVVVGYSNNIKYNSHLVCAVEMTPRLCSYIVKRGWEDMAGKAVKNVFDKPVWYSVENGEIKFRNTAKKY